MPINWFRSRNSPSPNASLYEKKLSKINLRIEKIAIKGKDNFIEYYKLVDELVNKGDYGSFEQCLYYYYGIEIQNQSLDIVKKETWKEISFQISTTFLKKLKVIYDKNKVYQISYDIYSSNDDFIQIGLSNPLSMTFSNTGFNQSFSIQKVDDVLKMNVIDKNLNYVSIERAEWVMIDGVEVPQNKTYVQDFFLGTASNKKDPNNLIQLEIPTNVMREYLIYTEEKQNTDISFTYSNSFTSSISGTFTVKWPFSSTASGYVMDISTSSSFQNILTNYQNLRLGTQSNPPNYIISGTTASYSISGLSNSTLYYFRVSKLVGKFAHLNYKVTLSKDNHIGRIIEHEIYTPDAQYLIQNRQYARLVGARKTYLEVFKKDNAMSSGFATASIFAYDDISRTEEANLLIRYTQAINYLNS